MKQLSLIYPKVISGGNCFNDKTAYFFVLKFLH